VLITPSFTADVAVNRISDKMIFRNFETVAYCAARFLYDVRGLPNDELEIETPEKIYTVTRDAKSGKIFVKLPKCKQLYTNKQENIDGIALNVSAVSCKDRIYKLTRCANAEHFAHSSLRTLLRSGLGDSIDGVAAYSLNGGDVQVRCILSGDESAVSYLFILLSVASAVFEKESSLDALTVKTNSLTILAVRCGEFISVCDEKCEIYTLVAPDNNFI
jgi:hypothetical protein